MAKYKKQVEEMLEIHSDIFTPFKELHDRYAQDPERFQDEYNEKGQEALRVIRRYENNLCNKSESGRYGKFSTSLSDKFWSEIRIHFPKIDSVGMS
jgi:uncharacterized protein (DUF2249 family)